MLKLTENVVKLVIATTLSLMLIQCGGDKKEKKTAKVDTEFTKYVTAFTSGTISNSSSINIRLKDRYPEAQPGEPIAKGIISFSPKLKGKAVWVDNRNIKFTPDEILPSATSFNGTFHLSKLIKGLPSKLKELKFNFSTKKQFVSVEFSSVKAYDPNDLTYQELKGEVTTSDNTERVSLERILNASQEGKNLKIKWTHSDQGNVHEFTVDSVRRAKSKGEVLLEWDGKYVQSESKDKITIDIPPLGDFKVLNVNVVQSPKQYISVVFSDPINDKQDIEGLVRLRSGTDVKLVRSGNEIVVYPQKRQLKSNTVIVEEGLRNSMGYQMKSRFSREVTFSSLKPDLRAIGNGVILPSSNGLVFPFKAVSLSGVNVKVIKVFENNVAQFFQVNQYNGKREMNRVGRVIYKKSVPLVSNSNIDYGEWNTFMLDLSKLIETEPGAVYRVHISFDRSQSLYPCGESVEDEELSFEEKPDEDFYDEPGYYSENNYDYSEYSWRDRDNPCKKSYYMGNNHSIVRNIIASDLGLIAKGGNNNDYKVVVSDIKTAEPMSGVNVEIYNYQNRLLQKSVTDSDGIVSVELKSKPFLLVAKSGSQKGYLRLDDGSSLSMSMFDIGGQKNSKGVKGFIYGERGVWRPGDSLYVSFILEDKNRVLPENHPVVFELYTPENKLYERKVLTEGVNEFYDFRTATKHSDPTGNWLAKVKVGGSEFTKYLKIETVKPNRLKIKLEFKDKILTNKSDLTGDLEVKWLHGAVAKNLNVDVEAELMEGRTSFKEYPGYTFDDPAKRFESESFMIFDNKVDAQGKAKVNAEFKVRKNAPGMLRAKFKIRAFEKGGDFSVDRFSKSYSPFSSYVGLKVPKGKGWNDALYSNEVNLIPIVTVSEDGKPVDVKDLKIEVFEIRWRWWWERSSDDDLARYISSRSTRKILTDKVSTVNGKVIYEMNLNRQSWGRKFIRVTNTKTGHSSGKVFYTSYKGWWNDSESGPGGAEMLTFSTDKRKYKVGEEVTVELPANDNGKALVSLETGSKVIDMFWVAPKTNNNKFKFTVTNEMAPNVYVHITYIQPYNSKDNDLPIRLYGVQNISVEDPDTHLSPQISMSDELRPEENVTIKVSEKEGKEMSYTIAVVDDGLLDLTRFRTPEAWSNFYKRETLGVKTWDMYKYVIGAYSGELSGLLAIGGGDEVEKKGGTKANRFKPVVKFMGPFTLRSGTNKHTFKMPNYVGSVRTMVVAANNGAYGSAQKTTPVRKPLMVLATMPRVVGPKEEVKLPVTVFAMNDKIKNVSVKVKTNDYFKVLGSKSQQLTFDQTGDKMTYFNLKVSPVTGVGRIKIIATSGGERAEYDVEIDVRMPNPRISRVIDAAVDAGKEWSTDYKPVGVKGTNNGTIEVSSIPPMNLEKRLNYLIRYPHGCVEQTTSSVFPQLHLSTFVELSAEKKFEVEDNIRAGIERLKGFITNSGGFAYWPGEDYASEWGSNYAGHFMLEAKAEGYQLPAGFLKNWVSYQKDKANNWSVDGGRWRYHYRSSQLVQAYRLYTLALAGKPALGAMNRMREMNKLSVASQWRLAAAYQLAGRGEVAMDIIKNIPTKVKEYKELSYSYGSSERDQAMILETLVLMNERLKAKEVLEQLAEQMSSDRWFSTQTTAYTLLAAAKFVGKSSSSTGVEYDYKLNSGKFVDVKSLLPVSQINMKLKDTLPGKVVIKNNGDKTLFVKVLLSGIPLDSKIQKANNNLNMTVKYTDMNGNSINPSRLTQGADFVAVVKLSHPGIRMNYKEMALTHIFPSGWEIRNIRMDGGMTQDTGDKPRYQDIRDDRVNTYFDLDKGRTKTFKVLLNAAYEGRFFMPAVYCEAMYDNEINASHPGEWVEVVKE